MKRKKHSISRRFKDWKVILPVIEMSFIFLFFYLFYIVMGPLIETIDGIILSSISCPMALILLLIFLPFAFFAGLVIATSALIFLIGTIGSLIRFFGDRGKPSIGFQLLTLIGTLVIPLLFLVLEVIRGFLSDELLRVYFVFTAFQVLYIIMITISYAGSMRMDPNIKKNKQLG